MLLFPSVGPNPLILNILYFIDSYYLFRIRKIGRNWGGGGRQQGDNHTFIKHKDTKALRH